MASTEKDVNLAMHELILKWELMYHTSMRRNHKRAFEDFSMLEIYVLRETGKRGGTCHLVDIRELMQIPNSTLTSIIKRLEKGGAITKEKDPDDNRLYILKLTDFGKEIDDQHVRMDNGVARNFIERVEDPRDVDAFVRAIRQATKESLVDDEFSYSKKRQ